MYDYQYDYYILLWFIKCIYIIIKISDFNDYNHNEYCTTEHENNDVFLKPEDIINWYKKKNK